MHVVVEARARESAVDLDAARSDLEHPLDHLHRAAARARREEGTEVAVAVLQDPPRHERARPVLPRRDLDVGIRLVVAEEDVVARLVLLDERVLEGERLTLGLGDDRVDRDELGEHRLGADVLRTRVEVRREPLADRPGFPDVEDLSLRVLVEVDAGLVGIEGEVRGAHGESLTSGGRRLLPGGWASASFLGSFARVLRELPESAILGAYARVELRVQIEGEMELLDEPLDVDEIAHAMRSGKSGRQLQFDAASRG